MTKPIKLFNERNQYVKFIQSNQDLSHITRNQNSYNKIRLEEKKERKISKIPKEEHLLTPSRVTTAVRMKTKGSKKARIRMV